MHQIPGLKKKARIGKWFVIVTATSLVIGFYIKDYKLAFGLFFGYALIRILMNFTKRSGGNNDYY